MQVCKTGGACCIADRFLCAMDEWLFCAPFGRFSVFGLNLNFCSRFRRFGSFLLRSHCNESFVSLAGEVAQYPIMRLENRSIGRGRFDIIC